MGMKMMMSLPWCCKVLMLLLHMQSLADVAREEAERRRRIDEQGVEVKVFVGNGTNLYQQGNLTTSTEAGMEKGGIPKIPEVAAGRRGLQHYRSGLQKLDRAIKQQEERITYLQQRLRSEKWKGIEGRKPTRAAGHDQGRIQSEIDGLQLKIKQLREERFELYEAGKKEGFLPGELEGKGIFP